MVLQTQILGTQTDGDVTYYNIRALEHGQQGKREIVARRRFSEFRELDMQLSSNAELSRTKLPHRNLFGFRRKFNIRHFNEHRQDCLDKYLSHIAGQVQSLQDNAVLATFLQDHRDPDTRAPAIQTGRNESATIDEQTASAQSSNILLPTPQLIVNGKACSAEALRGLSRQQLDAADVVQSQETCPAPQTQAAPAQTSSILSPQPQLEVTAEESNEEAPPREDSQEPDEENTVQSQETCQALHTQAAPARASSVLSTWPQLKVAAEESTEEAPPTQDGHEPGSHQKTCWAPRTEAAPAQTSSVLLPQPQLAVNAEESSEDSNEEAPAKQDRREPVTAGESREEPSPGQDSQEPVVGEVPDQDSCQTSQIKAAPAQTRGVLSLRMVTAEESNEESLPKREKQEADVAGKGPSQETCRASRAPKAPAQATDVVSLLPQLMVTSEQSGEEFLPRQGRLEPDVANEAPGHETYQASQKQAAPAQTSDIEPSEEAPPRRDRQEPHVADEASAQETCQAPRTEVAPAQTSDVQSPLPQLMVTAEGSSEEARPQQHGQDQVGAAEVRGQGTPQAQAAPVQTSDSLSPRPQLMFSREESSPGQDGREPDVATDAALAQSIDVLPPRTQLMLTAEESNEEAPPRQGGPEPDAADQVQSHETCHTLPTPEPPVQISSILSPRPQLMVTAEEFSEEVPSNHNEQKPDVTDKASGQENWQAARAQAALDTDFLSPRPQLMVTAEECRAESPSRQSWLESDVVDMAPCHKTWQASRPQAAPAQTCDILPPQPELMVTAGESREEAPPKQDRQESDVAGMTPCQDTCQAPRTQAAPSQTSSFLSPRAQLMVSAEVFNEGASPEQDSQDSDVADKTSCQETSHAPACAVSSPEPRLVVTAEELREESPPRRNRLELDVEVKALFQETCQTPRTQAASSHTSDVSSPWPQLMLTSEESGGESCARKDRLESGVADKVPGHETCKASQTQAAPGRTEVSSQWPQLKESPPMQDTSAPEHTSVVLPPRTQLVVTDGESSEQAPPRQDRQDPDVADKASDQETCQTPRTEAGPAQASNMVSPQLPLMVTAEVSSGEASPRQERQDPHVADNASSQETCQTPRTEAAPAQTSDIASPRPQLTVTAEESSECSPREDRQEPDVATQAAHAQSSDVLSPHLQPMLTVEESNEEAPPRQDGSEPDTADQGQGQETCRTLPTRAEPAQTSSVLMPQPHFVVGAEESGEEALSSQDGQEQASNTCSKTSCDPKDPANGTTPQQRFMSRMSEKHDISCGLNPPVIPIEEQAKEVAHSDPSLLLKESCGLVAQGGDLEVKVRTNKNTDLIKLSPERPGLMNAIQGKSDAGIVSCMVNTLESEEVKSSHLQKRNTISFPQLPTTGVADGRDRLSPYVHHYMHPALDFQVAFESEALNTALLHHTMSCPQLSTEVDKEQDFLSPYVHSYM